MKKNSKRPTKARPRAAAPVARKAAKKAAPPTAVRRVLFIHPSFPNQFSALATTLNAQPGFECYGLVNQAFLPAVAAAEPGLPYFGFVPDAQGATHAYPLLETFESGARNGLGIAAVLPALQQTYRFDAIIGHAAFGATLFLKYLFDGALISYVELPSFQTAAARLEFPPTFENALVGTVYEALIASSVLHSDLCITPSAHARRLFPLELQAKVRVQMEGFETEHLPTGGPDARAALGLPVEAKLVGFTGRTLEAVRGFDIFAQMARRLYERDASLRFLIVGEDQTIYGNETRYLGGRTFKDYALAQAGLPEEAVVWRRMMPHDEFLRHLVCLDLAVLPIFEGAANWSLFEAMSAGLPIVTSNRAFVPEVLASETESIQLDPYDAAAFAEQAWQLLHEPRRARALGAAARARIRRDFTLAQAADGYAAIIEEALALKAQRLT
ncbi:MAG: glycosyltransferase [Acidobacteria bacterium]|nr:glycosyltransferase [Acidobacteriota bacterium]MBI3422910.1 glycosyltransferase [Acidobacteriota bacterium]